MHSTAQRYENFYGHFSVQICARYRQKLSFGTRCWRVSVHCLFESSLLTGKRKKKMKRKDISVCTWCNLVILTVKCSLLKEKKRFNNVLMLRLSLKSPLLLAKVLSFGTRCWQVSVHCLFEVSLLTGKRKRN